MADDIDALALAIYRDLVVAALSSGEDPIDETFARLTMHARAAAHAYITGQVEDSP